MTGLLVALLVTLAGAGAEEAEIGPYLDSFNIQDSCQFNLCGPEYSQEFLLGQYRLILLWGEILSKFLESTRTSVFEG